MSFNNKISNRLSKKLSENGFKIHGDIGVVSVNGYVISIKEIQYSNYTVTLDTDNQQVDKSVLKQVVSNCKQKTGQKVSASLPNGKIAFAYIIKPNRVEKLLNYLGEFTKELQAINIKPNANCAICGSSMCDSVSPINSIYTAVHENCVSQNVEHSINQLKDKKTSYLLGIVGAILGTIVGVLPSVLTIMWAETIYAVLFILIPIAIIGGYKLFKGKLGIFSLILTIVLSLCSVLLMQFLTILITIMTEYGFDISTAIEFTMLTFQDMETLMYVFENSIMEYVFIGVGIFATWGQISTSEKSMQENASSIAFATISLTDLSNKEISSYK